MQFIDNKRMELTSCVIDKIIKYFITHKTVICNTILPSGISAFFAAKLANHYTISREEKKQKISNLDYLKYTIAMLAQLMNFFLFVKAQFFNGNNYKNEKEAMRQHIERLTHSEQRNIITIHTTSQHQEPTFQILYQYIIVPKNDLPIDTEKLHFLTNVNPNILIHLNELNSIMQTFYNTLEYRNECLKKRTESASKLDFYKKLYTSVDACEQSADWLIDSTDALISSLQKSGTLLSKKYGIKYKNQPVIIEEQYTPLIPPPKDTNLRRWVKGHLPPSPLVNYITNIFTK